MTKEIYEDIIAVTNRHLCAGSLAQQIERICSLPLKAVILREKDLPEEQYEALAAEIIPICEAHSVPLILHNYPEAAIRLGVRRIHLPLALLEKYSGGADHVMSGTDKSSRADEISDQNIFPDGFLRRNFDLIGTSVHSVQDALRAQSLGADYVNAGHIFATDCKKGVPPRGLDFLRDVCKAVNIPVYAIGGINLEPEKIQAVMDCGAAGACVMSALMKY